MGQVSNERQKLRRAQARLSAVKRPLQRLVELTCEDIVEAQHHNGSLCIAAENGDNQ
jgi:division protein CdvB (Snf7/Vps24/ESCRT-III family)